MGKMTRGKLVIIGGGEDKEGESVVLRHFISLVDYEKYILVITTATEKPQESGAIYREAFIRLGFEKVEILNINSRHEANSSLSLDAAAKAGGIFFTGGDQLRITSVLGGTKFYDALQDAFSNGVVLAGTSAGASVMSNTMIVDGDGNDPARKCTLKMAPGLGLLQDAIIDQHFHQRGRIGRLLCGVAENPFMLGIGIDEDTSITVLPNDCFEVRGANSVTVIDGRSIRESNVSESKPDEILAIAGATLHVLPDGYGFDMKKREVYKVG